MTISTTKKSFSTAQGDLENSYLENISLDLELDKVTDIDLASVYSFENSLFQVENFYLPLFLSRKQVCLDPRVEDGKIVSLRD